MHLYSGYTRVSQQQTTNATEHLMEFIFLLAEPTDILIHPTNHFGPDVVGFLFKSDNKKDRVLLVASQSFYSSHSPVKQAKNQKIGPQDWYSGYRAGSYFVTSLIQQNLLPTRRIQINFTLPNSNDNLMEYHKLERKS
jgi:hypothetical protein